MKRIKKILSIVVALTVITGLIPAMNSVTTKGQAVTTRYEAENSDVCTLVKVTSANSRIRTDIGTGGGAACIYAANYVTYKVFVQAEGDYDVVVNIACGNAAGELLVESGEQSKSITLANNGYKAFADTIFNLHLTSGENTIVVKHNNAETSNSFFNLDYIEITEGEDIENPEDFPAAEGRHEAEDAETGSAVTLQNDAWYAGCSNGAVIGIPAAWNGNSVSEGKYIAYKINAEEAGEYSLKVAYATTGLVELLAQVNDGEWTLFNESDAATKVLPDPANWREFLIATQTVELKQGINTIYVSGPICDWNANWQNVYGGIWGNIPAVNLDYIELEKVSIATGPEVTIDGIPIVVTDNKVKLGDAKYGYYCDGKMYRAQSEVAVEGDMAFTSVNELSVAMADGAGIRYKDYSGIRFQSTIISDNQAALADQNVITEGTLITAEDIYQNAGVELILENIYAEGEDRTNTEGKLTAVNVENSGWYNDTVGTYCGALCNIVETNYTRRFTARAYVTIAYEDGTTITEYSKMGPVRKISDVAKAIKDDNYRGIEEEYHGVIDGFIR